MKKTVFILAIVLVLAFMFTLSASATQPEKISGDFYFVDPWGPSDYCINAVDLETGEVNISGCVDQTEKSGLGQHGTLDLTFETPDGDLFGTCKYNLRAYDIDGIARFVANRCNGDLTGLHLKGQSIAYTLFWDGSYHFSP